MWDKKPGKWYLWEMRNDFYELRKRCNIFKNGGQRPGLAREPVCCYCKFFSSSLERIAQLHWTNLGNHIYLYLFTRGNYSLTGSPLTRLEAPFPLPFKGSNMAETQRRAFRCSMNQQDTLTARKPGYPPQKDLHKGAERRAQENGPAPSRLRGIAFKSRAVMKIWR